LLALPVVAKAAVNATTGCTGVPLDNLMETTMQWTTPSYTDMRFGFEITMYIATR
jgi:coenzyme PQQ precursor peptide PqqA